MKVRAGLSSFEQLALTLVQAVFGRGRIDGLVFRLGGLVSDLASSQNRQFRSKPETIPEAHSRDAGGTV